MIHLFSILEIEAKKQTNSSKQKLFSTKKITNKIFLTEFFYQNFLMKIFLKKKSNKKKHISNQNFLTKFLVKNPFIKQAFSDPFGDQTNVSFRKQS